MDQALKVVAQKILARVWWVSEVSRIFSARGRFVDGEGGFWKNFPGSVHLARVGETKSHVFFGFKNFPHSGGGRLKKSRGFWLQEIPPFGRAGVRHVKSHVSLSPPFSSGVCSGADNSTRDLEYLKALETLSTSRH